MGWVVPLLQGMDAAARAAGSDGDGRDVEGKGDVGIGGGEARFGAEGEVAVYGAKGVEQGRVVGKDGSGTVSDGFDVESGGRVVGVWSGKGVDGVGEDAGDVASAGGELAGIDGAEVEEGGCEFGDGIDGDASGDLSDVKGGVRRTGYLELIEPGKGVTEDENGVGGSGIGPGMAARTGDGETEADTAEGPGDDGVAAAAFEGDG